LQHGVFLNLFVIKTIVGTIVTQKTIFADLISGGVIEENPKKRLGMPMTKGLQVIPSCDPDGWESGFKSSASHEEYTGYRGRGYDRDESQERMIL
jgi:hypothetical protein